MDIYRIRPGASFERLEALISSRLQPDADKKSIDSRIWDLFGETWSVMFTDLSGFSRNVSEFGIIHFLQIIFESQRLLVPCIDEFDGVLLKMEGDSMMVLFRSPDKALKCSMLMQKTLKKYNKNRLPEEQVILCVGLGYGDILKIGDQDVFGNEVNAASKLGEDIAEANEILVTRSVKKAVKKNDSFKFEKIKDIPPGAKSAYKLLYIK